MTQRLLLADLPATHMQPIPICGYPKMRYGLDAGEARHSCLTWDDSLGPEGVTIEGSSVVVAGVVVEERLPARSAIANALAQVVKRMDL